mgnify:CR=1 FL=1
MLQYPLNFPWILCRFHMISLDNIRGFPWKSATDLSPMNPPEILINSAGNLEEIPKESTWKIPLNFHIDSRFTYNPNFHVGSPPPFTAIPGDSPQNPSDFVLWVTTAGVEKLLKGLNEHTAAGPMSSLLNYSTQRASHPRLTDFHMDLWGNFGGSFPWKFYPHFFPVEIQEK